MYDFSLFACLALKVCGASCRACRKMREVRRSAETPNTYMKLSSEVYLTAYVVYETELLEICRTHMKYITRNGNMVRFNYPVET